MFRNRFVTVVTVIFLYLFSIGLPIQANAGTLLDTFTASIGGYSTVYTVKDFDGKPLPSDNLLVIDDDYDNDIAGGYSDNSSGNSNILRNIVTIDGDHTIAGGILGGMANTGSVGYNEVYLDFGTVEGDVIGGFSNKGRIYNNKVVIGNIKSASDVVVENTVLGGLSTDSGEVRNNSVVLDGITSGSVTIDGDVIGGKSKNGTVAGNRVDIRTGDISGDVYGGTTGDVIYRENILATNNTVLIRKSNNGAAATNIIGDVYGGYNSNGGTRGNLVGMDYGQVDGDIYGGKSDVGDARDNGVVITGGTLNNTSDVYAGHAGGDTINNSVFLSDMILDNVYGGYSETIGKPRSDAIGNSVTIARTDASNVWGGLTNMGSASNNGVVIGYSSVVSDNIYGGYVENLGNAEYNNVSIDDSTVAHVYGGYSKDGVVANNSVRILNATAENIYGGASKDGFTANNSVYLNNTVAENIYGGKSDNADAYGNRVYVVGEQGIGENIYGGYSKNGNVYNNSVTVGNGATVELVYGGYSEKGAATGNTVTLSGNIVANGSALYGGYSEAVDADFYTGNTLNVNNYHGIVFSTVANFQNYNFNIDGNDAKNGYTVMVAQELDLGAGANIGINISGRSELGVGDKLTLIKSYDNKGWLSNSEYYGFGGISLLYDFNLATEQSGLTATVNKVSANPQLKALSEGQVAGVTMVSQGADLIAGDGLTSAVASTGNGKGLSNFVAFSGGTTRYNSGSYVDVDGFSGVVGGSVRRGTSSGNIIGGIFLETGKGNYESHNSFVNVAPIEGEGKSSYMGAGMLGQISSNSGKYMDISFRSGEAKTEFHADGFGSYNADAEYETKNPYYGAHMKVGVINKLSSQTSLDLATAFIWLRSKGDTVEVEDDSIIFDDVTSMRARVIGKISYGTGMFSPFLGVAYEYEFDGDANASIRGYEITAPSLKGETTIAELGVSLKGESVPFSMNFALQYYGGVREGLAGSAQFVIYSF